MLHYVMVDGGMIVIPKEELVRWIGEREDDPGEGYSVLADLLAELEAMGR